MSDFDLVVKGTLVTSERIVAGGFIAVRDGVVAQVGAGAPPNARESLDFGQCYILPGVVDGQVHTGSQQDQEGFGPASRAAAAGGVTTMVDMPYDEPIIVSTPAQLMRKAEAAAAASVVDFALYATISPDDGVTEIPGLIEAGACAFKFSTFESHPQRFPRIPPALMERACSAIASSGLAVGVHNENQEYIATRMAEVRATGDTSPAAHGKSRPPLSELLAINEIYEIGAYTGCRMHVVHCSLGRGIEICESYRQQGYQVSTETCIHYLTLTEDDVLRFGGRAKVNPPIRPAEEREALWRHLAAGHIDFVSTDHVAWSADRKSHADIFKNSSGMTGMETILPLFFKECLERSLDLRLAPRLLSEGPARHFRLHPRKGHLGVGADADVAVLEPGDFRYDATNGQTIVDWTPFHDVRLPVRVAATFRRGQLVWDGAQVPGGAGGGQFITPQNAAVGAAR